MRKCQFQKRELSMNKTIFLASLFVGVLAADPTLAATPETSPSTISLAQAIVEDPGHPGIVTAIWAPATGNGLGLIVISHGTGAGPTAHIDTAQALANAGFVVAAPMHTGDNFQDDASVGKPQWFVDRSRHVSKVVDYMLGQWGGRSRIDPNRIGMFGMSAGATTALIVAGGELDLARVTDQCKTQPEFVCQIMAPTDPNAPAVKFVRDKRIAAEVLAAPGLGFAFAPQTLENVKVPVQLWVGSADQTVPYATNAALVRSKLGPDVEFHTVENAVHLSFLAPCGPEINAVICKDNPGFDRSAFHEKFNQSIVGFFKAKLSGKAK
jgi:predicted dienelactone hydrolase